MRPLRTVSAFANIDAEGADIRKVFHTSSLGSYGSESTVLERHTQELLHDQRYELRLESDLASGASAGDVDARNSSALGGACARVCVCVSLSFLLPH